MYKLVILFAFLVLSVYAYVLHTANPYSDEHAYAEDSTVPSNSASSYEKALQVWKSPEDINGWIAANFSYDAARAIRLSETRRTKNESVSIYSPSTFFETKTGVCVDLSRFSVETLRQIDPHSDPKYLMIEFEPIQIRGDTFRLHWLVSFRLNGKAYFFSDSKRPGYIAGPYNNTQAFVDEYEQYRSQKIVAFRELDSYRKQRGTKAKKRQATMKP
jgi:hypothetical protein